MQAKGKKRVISLIFLFNKKNIDSQRVKFGVNEFKVLKKNFVLGF